MTPTSQSQKETEWNRIEGQQRRISVSQSVIPSFNLRSCKTFIPKATGTVLSILAGGTNNWQRVRQHNRSQSNGFGDPRLASVYVVSINVKATLVCSWGIAKKTIIGTSHQDIHSVLLYDSVATKSASGLCHCQPWGSERVTISLRCAPEDQRKVDTAIVAV